MPGLILYLDPWVVGSGPCLLLREFWGSPWPCIIPRFPRCGVWPIVFVAACRVHSATPLGGGDLVHRASSILHLDLAHVGDIAACILRVKFRLDGR